MREESDEVLAGLLRNEKGTGKRKGKRKGKKEEGSGFSYYQLLWLVTLDCWPVAQLPSWPRRSSFCLQG